MQGDYHHSSLLCQLLQQSSQSIQFLQDSLVFASLGQLFRVGQQFESRSKINSIGRPLFRHLGFLAGFPWFEFNGCLSDDFGGYGLVSGLHTYSQQRTLCDPDESIERKQYKNTPSNYEPENFYTKGGQLCFHKSNLGSFSVILCSDLREFDVISAIEAEPFLDFLVVCSCNSHTNLWRNMAIADATRLHCFVIVSNWSEKAVAAGFGDGSLCAAPLNNPENSYELPSMAIKVDFPTTGQVLSGALLLYDLNLAALFRDRHKPASGFLSPPKRRLRINKSRT